MKRYITCMTIAGSDPSGGAGIQADLKTFAALGCYGQAAITALTVQNTLGVKRSVAVDSQLLREQVEAVWQDVMPDAVKIGITATADIIRMLAELIEKWRPPFVVLDPVMISSSGHRLMDPDACTALRDRLMPVCHLITPNIPEAKALLGEQCMTPMECMAQTLSHQEGGAAVLVKGGHSDGEPTDVLYADGCIHTFTAPRISTRNTHGTGCTLSSAIAAYHARGCSLPEAVAKAKSYLSAALEAGAMVYAGHGNGSMNHFFAPESALMKENA